MVIKALAKVSGIDIIGGGNGGAERPVVHGTEV